MQTKSFIALVIGASAISFASPAPAQESERDKVIHACITRVQQQYPNVADASAQSSRLAAYRSCMQAAGQNP